MSSGEKILPSKLEAMCSCQLLMYISGHYHSRNTDVLNFVDDAPGADDE
jgi:hypothetical protein